MWSRPPPADVEDGSGLGLTVGTGRVRGSTRVASPGGIAPATARSRGPEIDLQVGPSPLRTLRAKTKWSKSSGIGQHDCDAPVGTRPRTHPRRARTTPSLKPVRGGIRRPHLLPPGDPRSSERQPAIRETGAASRDPAGKPTVRYRPFPYGSSPLRPCSDRPASARTPAFVAVRKQIHPDGLRGTLASGDCRRGRRGR